MANNTKDLDQLIKRGRAEGWTVEKTNGGHWKWTHPRIETAVFTSSTPSDWRMIRNHEAIMVRVAKMGTEQTPKKSICTVKRKRTSPTKLHADSRSPVIY